MSIRFKFVPSLDAHSTPRDQELRDAEIRKHAATISHRRKFISLVESQRASPDPHACSKSRRKGEPQQKDLVIDLSVPKNKALTHGRSGSRGRDGSIIFARESLQDSESPPDASLEGRTASKSSGATSPSVQRSLSEESEEVGEAEVVETVTALLKTVTCPHVLSVIQTATPTKTTKFIPEGHPASFYRAIEYCTYVQPRTRTYHS